MKDTKRILQDIWDKKAIGYPALVVEESAGHYQNSGNIDKSAGSEYDSALAYYESLNRSRGDNIPALNATLGTYIFPSVFGAKIKTFADGHKYVAEPLIRRAEDVDRIRPTEGGNYLKKQLELIEEFARRTKGKIPIRMPDIQNPLGVAEMMWDSDDFYVSLYDEPERVHKLLGMICEQIVGFVRRVKEVVSDLVPISWPWVWAPGKGVHISDDTMSMVSPQMYEEYGVRYNNILSREFDGIYLHSCTMNERYFSAIEKNEKLYSVNFAAQYSSDMEKIFSFFSGKAVIIPHYVYTDNPQIGTVEYFLEKVAASMKENSDCIIFVAARPDNAPQDSVFETYAKLFGKKRSLWTSKES